MAVLIDESVTTPEGESRDLGFGAVVAAERKRLLNRDGSFNVRRSGLGFWQSNSLYHTLLTMSWARFLTLLVLAYVAINALFAAAYDICGPSGLEGNAASNALGMYARAFFFSVQTFGTIGYGAVDPVGMATNTIVGIESLFGLLGFALATGIMFARFSRPLAQVKFSRRAVMAPFKGKRAFMFRIANRRSNELIEVEARIVLSMFVTINGTATRRFSTLKLERTKVAFLPLSWTIVHPIDEESPLWGLSEEDYARYGVEFLVLLTAIDETFSQTVHARMSYSFEELEWNARFSDIFGRTQDAATLTVDISRIDTIEPVTT
jgi:inward rectifier potassium channel